MCEGLTQESRSTQVERLVEEGLALYGVGREAEAIACWSRALELEPEHEAARDYLESVGVETNAKRERTRDAIVTSIATRAGKGSSHRARVDGIWNELKASRLLEALDLVIQREDLVEGTTNDPRAREFFSLVDGRRPMKWILAELDCSVPEFWRIVASSLRPGALERARERQQRPQRSAPIQEPRTQPVEVPTFDELFREGVKLTLSRDYNGAKRAFEACDRLRPGDPRVRANLRKLAERTGS